MDVEVIKSVSIPMVKILQMVHCWGIKNNKTQHSATETDIETERTLKHVNYISIEFCASDQRFIATNLVRRSQCI